MPRFYQKIAFLTISCLVLLPSFGQSWCQQRPFHHWLQTIAPHTQHSVDDWCHIFATQSCNPTILSLAKHPYEHRSWPTYKRHFMTPSRLHAGHQYLKKHRMIFKKAEDTYHVPAGIIAAILGVETNYGHNMGQFSASSALLTLGFCQEKRARFFRQELAALMQLSDQDHLDISKIHSSYAGALGIPQFMPSNYHTLGIRATAQYPLDLFHHHDDAILSIAHFLAMKGWHAHQPIVHKRLRLDPLTPDAQRHPQPIKSLSKSLRNRLSANAAGLYQPSNKVQYEIYDNFNVLLRYNRSPQYALAVTLMAQQLQPKWTP